MHVNQHRYRRIKATKNYYKIVVRVSSISSRNNKLEIGDGHRIFQPIIFVGKDASFYFLLLLHRSSFTSTALFNMETLACKRGTSMACGNFLEYRANEIWIVETHVALIMLIRCSAFTLLGRISYLQITLSTDNITKRGWLLSHFTIVELLHLNQHVSKGALRVLYSISQASNMYIRWIEWVLLQIAEEIN